MRRCLRPLSAWIAAGLLAMAPSSHPNSTVPRIFEPAATVSDPAFTSPVIAPPCCSSTRLALSMLPCSSPLTITSLARTWPSTLAPESMCRLPSTWTSPLNLPATRTWPLPMILPSIDETRCDDGFFHVSALLRRPWPVQYSGQPGHNPGQAGAGAAGRYWPTESGSGWPASNRRRVRVFPTVAMSIAPLQGVGGSKVTRSGCPGEVVCETATWRTKLEDSSGGHPGPPAPDPG